MSTPGWFRDRIGQALSNLEPDHPAALVLAQALDESDWSRHVFRLPERACERCGGSYQPIRTDQRWCSHVCRSEVKRERVRARYVPTQRRHHKETQ